MVRDLGLAGLSRSRRSRLREWQTIVRLAIWWPRERP